MSSDYTIRLTGRQEGVEYRAAGQVYRFDVLLRDGSWELYLPGSRGDAYASYELTDVESAEILPRIVAYLAEERLFGIRIGSYPVHVRRRPEP